MLKNEKIAFWATLWLRGNVRSASIARWKSRNRLPICHNWTFFAISYDWDVISGICRSRRFSKEVGQGWINLCGGPRLDTAMGPYHLLSSPTRTEFEGYHPRKKFKLQTPVSELYIVFLAELYRPVCQDELAIFTDTTKQ